VRAPSNQRPLPAHQTGQNALGDDYVWEYDNNGNLAKEINEEDDYKRYEYDKHNRLIFAYQSIDGREIRTGYQYDDNGNRTHVTDARDNTTETRYDTWNAYCSCRTKLCD